MTMNPKVEFAVIFDFDGTLADSMGAWRNLQTELCQRCGMESTNEVMRELNPLTIPEIAAYFHARGLGESEQDVLDIIDATMRHGYAHEVVLKPGAAQLVNDVHEAGIPVSVVSATPHYLIDIALEALNLSAYVDHVVSVDDVGHSKREPHAFLKAAELMNCPVEDALVVEDSLYAIRTAKDAGFHTLAVYDMDESGTVEELKTAAHSFVLTLESVTVSPLRAFAL